MKFLKGDYKANQLVYSFKTGCSYHLGKNILVEAHLQVAIATVAMTKTFVQHNFKVEKIRK